LEIFTNAEISTGSAKNSRHNCARKKKSAKKSENGDEKSARRVTAAHVTRPQRRRAVTARVDIARALLLLQDMVALTRTRGMFMTRVNCQKKMERVKAC
jgi:hypothetical protein